MAKKTVATLKTGKGRDFTRVIKMERSPKTGAYAFRDEIVHNDHIKDFLEGRPVAQTAVPKKKKDPEPAEAEAGPKDSGLLRSAGGDGKE